MNYKEALQYIDSIKGYGIVPGLDSIRELCRRLGSPQEQLKFVHIAGTNGKGSVLAYLSSILKRAGYKTGKYISPVIFEYREKIQVGSRFITQAALCEGMEIIRDICCEMVQDGMPHPTPFEVETALAFWYFKKMECDIVVLETGMGGREDATNLITGTAACVITNISMDHMQFLGNTLAKIAYQKAGILKEGSPVITMVQQPEAMEVIEETAGSLHCDITVAEEGKAEHVRYGVEKQRFDYGGLKGLAITLAGKHQIANAVLAVETVKVLNNNGFSISESALRKGLEETKWLGRFTVLGKKPYFIVDGAHNEDAARKLAQSMEYYFTNKRIIYIIGMLKDKDYEKIIGLTHFYADQILTITPPDNPRAMKAYDLAREIARVHPAVTALDSLEEAVEMSHLLAGKDDVILAFGSLSYLGKLMELEEKRSRVKAK